MSVSFDAEHLVNLELNEQTGVGKPEQAIIRLHQLHASKLLQPAKVHLRLEKTHLLIVNRGTGVVVEKLPYPEVEAHNELFVRSVSDRHKNLLLLTVTDSLAVVPPEFFILQFASSSPLAKEFLDTFNDFKRNHKRDSNYKNSLSSPLTSPASQQDDFNDFQAKQAAQATLKYKAPTPHKGLDTCLYEGLPPPQQKQQTQPLLSKYMELLNRCLDDVEEFVARLRVAASNYQELQDWKMQKKYGAHGGGIRMMRSQPPPPHEFFSIFQKIKLAFNIMPKLKGHIKSPNAPELVHFLFHPLDFLVEASLAVVEPNEEPIWQRVITPLFQQDTLNFFDDCLVSNEADLLKSLGTAWNISSDERDFWLSCVSEVPVYRPTFADGWSPTEEVISQLSVPIHSTSNPSHGAQHHTINRPSLLPQSCSTLHDQGALKVQKRMSSGSQNLDSPSTSQQEKSPFVISPVSSSPQQPSTPHKPPTPFHDQQAQEDFLNSILSKGSMVYITTEDRLASNDQEFDVKKGEAFEVLESNRLHSKVKTSAGLIGYLPSNILQPLNSISEQQLDDYGVSKRKGLSAMDHLNREFQHKLSHYPQEAPKKREAVVTVSINEKSSPQDVAVWLAAKGFDEKTQQMLASFGGKQLFVMDKKVFEKLFGVDMGGRLYSQVLVQRNKSGYKTMRANELSSILEGRKKKSDSVILSDMFQPPAIPDNTTPSCETDQL